MLKDAVPSSAFGPAGKAAVHVFEVAEALRQVAPGDTGAVAVEYGVDKQTVVRSGYANRTGPTRQQVLGPVQLVIAESVSAHRSAFPKLAAYESKNHCWNLEASVRSRDTDDATRSERDFIEAGLT
jgi:hypothetical protein